MNKNNNNSQYIEGNFCIRLAIFAFLGLWILTGFLLKPIAEKKIEQINTAPQRNAFVSLNDLRDIHLKFIVIPMSIFLTIQGLYLLRLGVKTLRAGIYPPPAVKMPFRTKIQTRTKAKMTAIMYLFAGLCNFTIIALLLKMRHEIFRHI